MLSIADVPKGIHMPSAYLNVYENSEFLIDIGRFLFSNPRKPLKKMASPRGFEFLLLPSKASATPGRAAVLRLCLAS